MAEFSAAANLEVRFDEASIRNARARLERELSDPVVPVEVGAPSTRSMAPDGGTAAAPFPSGNFSAMQAQLAGTLDATTELVDFAEERNDFLEEILDEIETGNRMDARGGGGGGLGTFGLGLGARSLLGGAGGALGTLGLGAGAAAGGIAAGGAAGILALNAALFGGGELSDGGADLARSNAHDLGRTGGGNNLFEAIGDVTGAELPRPSWLPDLLGWDPAAPDLSQTPGPLQGSPWAGTGGAAETSFPGVTPPELRDSPWAGTGGAAETTFPTGDDRRNRGGSARRTGNAAETGVRITVNNNVTANGEGVNQRDVERVVERKNRELKREIERLVSSGSGGRI